MSDESQPAAPESSASIGSAADCSSGRLFGLVLVLIVVAAGASIWWYIGQQSAAAEKAAFEAIRKLSPDVLVREGADGAQINVSLLKDKGLLDQAAESFGDLATVNDFNASNNDVFADEHLKGLTHIAALRSLQLNYTGITDDGLADVANLTDLKALYVHGTNITEKGVASINGLKNLTNLNISGTKVTGDLSELIGLQKLNWLVLNELALEDGVADTLAKLPQLSRVTMSTSTMSQAAVQKLKDAKPDLRIDEPGEPR